METASLEQLTSWYPRDVIMKGQNNAERKCMPTTHDVKVGSCSSSLDSLKGLRLKQYSQLYLNHE